MIKFVLSSILYFLTLNALISQENPMKLWPGIIPNHQQTDEVEIHENSEILWITYVQEPTMEVFLPAKKGATGRAVVICPGGGYSGLSYDSEGTDIAKWLNSKGIAAFVLKSRLPNSKSVITSDKAPLQDAQRAIRLVRDNAEKWNIARDQIGIMGFSAGGHLASTLGAHYDEDIDFEGDAIDTLSARPDFMVLVYPVISMSPSYTHQGSKDNLLGENPDQTLVDFYSAEMHVDENTPPTFLIHTTDDKTVQVMNSILMYQALSKEKVYSEMHIYPEGGHGYGLAIGMGYLQTWTDRLADWMEGLK